MFKLEQRPPPHAWGPAKPTAFLAHVAGARATKIARVFAPPHADYFTLPTARRHMLHMALDRVAPDALDRDAAAALATDALYARGDHFVARRIGDPGEGFVKALARIGEAPWDEAAYATLLARFAEPKAALVLRQTAAIAPAFVAKLADLAAPLCEPGIVRQLNDADDSWLLSEAHAALVWRDGVDRGALAIERWSRAGSRGRLFKMAAEDLRPVGFEPPPPPPRHALLAPLQSTHALKLAGLRFRNCLETYAMEAGEGRSALYVMAGPPPLVVELRRDVISGWRPAQIRGHKNEPAPQETRGALRALFAELGLWIGRPGREIWDCLAQSALGDRADIYRGDVFGLICGD
jgi:hypothetical protein